MHQKRRNNVPPASQSLPDTNEARLYRSGDTPAHAPVAPLVEASQVFVECGSKSKEPGNSLSDQRVPKHAGHLCVMSMQSTGASAHVTPDTWLIVSAANTHTCNNKKWFKTFQKWHGEVSTASKDRSAPAHGFGTVSMALRTNSKDIILDLSDVVYTPSGRYNAFCMSRFIEETGARMIQDDAGMKFTMPGDMEETVVGLINHVLYHLSVQGPAYPVAE